MKARLAKKILLSSEKKYFLGSEKKKRYWIKRVIKASFGWKEDHRVVKALQIFHRKSRRKGVSYE